MSVEQRAHVLRLDGQQHDVGLRGRLLRRRGADAVPLGDLLGPLGVPLRGEHGRGRQSRPQQARQQRLAELADAEQRDGLLMRGPRRVVSGASDVVGCSRLARQRAQEEHQVGGPLGQTSHEIAVPLSPYGT
jgi:hypothetical protein